MPLLDFDAFRRSLKKGEFQPAYYFHGDEDLLKDDGLRDLLAAAVDASTRDFNFDRRRAAELSGDDFATLALTPPMMAPRRAVVITECEVLQQRRAKAQGLRAAITDYLASASPDTLLVLVQSSGEKVDRDLVRLAAAVPFERLQPARLEKWIRHRAKQEGLDLDEAGARHLHAAVGDDLPQLAAEIAKLRAAVPDRTATAADVADLVGVRHGETIHDFLDAVTSRRFAAAADLVRHLLEGPGTSGVRLVIALGTVLTGVALARALLDRGLAAGAVAGELKNAMFSSRPFGLRGYDDEARRWAADARGWTMSELDHVLSELLRADRRLKSTTLGGDVEIVTDLVLGMAGTAAAA